MKIQQDNPEIAIPAWDIIESKIRSFASLPEDWDSHGSHPISAKTIDAALLALDSLKNVGAIPKYAVPMCDDGIELTVKKNDSEHEFDIGGESISVCILKGNNEPEYRDIKIDEIKELVQ